MQRRGSAPRRALTACRECSVGWGPATSPHPSKQAFPKPLCRQSEGNTVRLSPSQSGWGQRVHLCSARVVPHAAHLLESVQVSHRSPRSQTCHSTGFIRCLVSPGDEIPVGQEVAVPLCASTGGGREILMCPITGHVNTGCLVNTVSARPLPCKVTFPLYYK